MDDKRRQVMEFVFGLVGAIVCVAISILVSIYAQHAAMIIDPIMIGIAIACLGITARSIGFKIGASAAIVRDDSGNFKPQNKDKRPHKTIHLVHHFPKKKQNPTERNGSIKESRDLNKSESKIQISRHKNHSFFKKIINPRKHYTKNSTNQPK